MLRGKGFNYPNGLSAGCCGNCNFELPNFLWITSWLCGVSARAGFSTVVAWARVQGEWLKTEGPCRPWSTRRALGFILAPSPLPGREEPGVLQGLLGCEPPHAQISQGPKRKPTVSWMGFPSAYVEYLMMLVNQPCPTPGLAYLKMVSQKWCEQVGQVALFSFLCQW